MPCGKEQEIVMEWVFLGAHKSFFSFKKKKTTKNCDTDNRIGFLK